MCSYKSDLKHLFDRQKVNNNQRRVTEWCSQKLLWVICERERGGKTVRCDAYEEMLLREYIPATFVYILVVPILMLKGDRPCSMGQCVEVQYCPSARAAIRQFGTHTLQRCGWNRLIEKVCCTDSRKTDISTPRENSSDEDVSVWPGDGDGGTDKKTTPPVSDKMETTTIKPTETRDTVRKSEAACARYSSTVPITVNWHIYGGEAAQAGEFPHMVALGYPNTDSDSDNTDELVWNCAGSLLSDKYVLTAAHCVLRTKPAMARVGALRLSKKPPNVSDHQIMNITIHPEYERKSGRHDVALLEIAVVKVGGSIYPACLYTRSDDPLGLLITGWGKTAFGQDVRSDILQKARVSAIALDSCNATYIKKLKRALGFGQMCAGPADPQAPTDSCPGDSGGPLQVFTPENVYAVVGVISFGITDCGGDSPSVYTRVYYYLDWIEKIVWP